MIKLSFNTYKLASVLFAPTLLLLFVFSFSSCKKDNDTDLIEANHQVIFTSEMDFQNTIQVEGSISFGDVSSGVASRTWTFPEGVDIVDSDNDVTSTEANVKAIFNEVGQFDVRLQQTFKSDAFVGQTMQGRDLDTTIVVTVLDFIEATVEAHYINQDGTIGEPLNIADNARNEIPAARSIRYTFTGVGTPRTINWQLDGGDPDVFIGTQYQVDVKYKFLGTYNFAIIPSRARPFGIDTLAYENLITVIPSTDPVVVDQIVEQDGNIAVVFSREVDAATLRAEDFSVTVENGFYFNNSTITAATIDPNQGNVVLLALDNEPLYNNDFVRVNFTQGNLFSLDGVEASSFENELMTFITVNILPTTGYDYSFENTMSDDWQYLEWGDNWGDFTLEISSEQAYEGEKSALVEMLPGGGMVVSLKDAAGEDITFPGNNAKQYELGLWIYAESLGDPTAGLPPDLRIYWAPDTNWGIGPNPEMNAAFPIGEWSYSSAFVEFADTGQKSFMIRGFNTSNPMAVKIFLDNITLAEVKLRP